MRIENILLGTNGLSFSIEANLEYLKSFSFICGEFRFNNNIQF